MKLIEDYIISLTNLYGIVHKEKVMEIYNMQNKDKIDLLEIDTVIEEKQEKLSYDFVEMHEDYFVHESIIYFDEVNEELAEKSGKPYFIPDKHELLKYKDEFYFEKTKEYKRLQRYVTKHFTNGDKDAAEEICEDIQLVSETDPAPSNLLNEFDRRGITFKDDEQATEIIDIIINLVNNTRLWVNNGYTPNELSKLGEEKKNEALVKVGWNDPCPCGSGKKYKKCCIDKKRGDFVGKGSQFYEDLNIHYPILQAPMAGVTTPELVAAVSNAGALGNLAAGYVSTKGTKEMIQTVKKMTNNPFGINLFVPEESEVTEAEVERSVRRLKFSLNDLQIEELHRPQQKLTSNFEEQIDIVIEEKVPVCSFTFGLPSEKNIKRLKVAGVFIIGTATTVREAQAIERVGMDAVIVQGSEAGGHRGGFLDEENYIGLMSLIPQVVDHVTIPVIAAGGIMDGRGVNASLCLGAEAAQLGTAFLTTKESGAHSLHKQSILQATEEDLQFTRAFSGKTARGIRNKFITTMEKHENDILPFPHQNSLTRQIRSIAAKQNNTDYMSLWSGQSPRLSKDVTVKELMGEITKDLDISQG